MGLQLRFGIHDMIWWLLAGLVLIVIPPLSWIGCIILSALLMIWGLPIIEGR